MNAQRFFRTTLFITIVACACAGCSKSPSEQAVRRIATDAILGVYSNTPPQELSITMEPYPAKNAGCVEVRVSRSGADPVLYHVWVKRVARRWEFDRITTPSR